MTLALSRTRPAPAVAPGIEQQTLGERPRPVIRVLAVVDGSEQTNRVTNYILSACDPRATDVVVLNVQEKRNDARLRGYQSFKREEIDSRLIDEVGMPIVKNVSRILEKSGIPAVPMVRIGERIPTILQCARDENCDIIVIADSAPATQPLRRMLQEIGINWFGSAASGISTLSPRPVVIVK